MTQSAQTLTLGPQLATNCYFVGHAQKADAIWSCADFKTIRDWMLNGNDPRHFMLVYRDKDGIPRHKKSRTRDAEKIGAWAYDTIKGTAKGKTGIGFYPCNPDRKTRWGALDIDAHDGQRDRARDLAFKAFALLCRHESLWIILGTSGQSGGWHLFIFARDFYPVSEWARLLREVVEKIGAHVQKGLVEILPNEARGIGNGIRCPGSWNPKDDSFGLIAFDNATPQLLALASPTGRGNGAAIPKGEPCSLGTRSSTYGEKQTLPSSENQGLFRGERGQWQSAFAITAPSTRHERLTQLVGHIFHQVGLDVGRENARLQFLEANPSPVATLDEHLSEFDRAWDGMERQWLGKLSASERVKYDELSTGNERGAFKVVRGWSRTADTGSDFKLHAKSLARRISLMFTLAGACNARNKFCLLGILKKTAPYVPHKLAARYRWLLADPLRRPHSSIPPTRCGRGGRRSGSGNFTGAVATKGKKHD
jgi:hypothetical protein